MPSHGGTAVGLRRRDGFAGRAREPAKAAPPATATGSNRDGDQGTPGGVGGGGRHLAGQPRRVLGLADVSGRFRFVSLPAAFVNGRFHLPVRSPCWALRRGSRSSCRSGRTTGWRGPCRRGAASGDERRRRGWIPLHTSPSKYASTQPSSPLNVSGRLTHKHGLLAAGGQVGLADFAVAAQHPDLILAFLPPVGLARAGRDFGAFPRHGQRDFGGMTER